MRPVCISLFQTKQIPICTCLFIIASNYWTRVFTFVSNICIFFKWHFKSLDLVFYHYFKTNKTLHMYWYRYCNQLSLSCLFTINSKQGAHALFLIISNYGIRCASQVIRYLSLFHLIQLYLIAPSVLWWFSTCKLRLNIHSLHTHVIAHDCNLCIWCPTYFGRVLSYMRLQVELESWNIGGCMFKPAGPLTTLNLQFFNSGAM